MTMADRTEHPRRTMSHTVAGVFNEPARRREGAERAEGRRLHAGPGLGGGEGHPRDPGRWSSAPTWPVPRRPARPPGAFLGRPHRRHCRLAGRHRRAGDPGHRPDRGRRCPGHDARRRGRRRRGWWPARRARGRGHPRGGRADLRDARQGGPHPDHGPGGEQRQQAQEARDAFDRHGGSDVRAYETTATASTTRPLGRRPHEPVSGPIVGRRDGRSCGPVLPGPLLLSR